MMPRRQPSEARRVAAAAVRSDLDEDSGIPGGRGLKHVGRHDTPQREDSCLWWMTAKEHLIDQISTITVLHLRGPEAWRWCPQVTNEYQQVLHGWAGYGFLASVTGVSLILGAHCNQVGMFSSGHSSRMRRELSTPSRCGRGNLCGTERLWGIV